MSHRADDARHFGGGLYQVVNQRVDRFDQTDPGAVGDRRGGALCDLTVTSYDSTDPLHLFGQAVIDLDHVVERVGDLSVHPAQSLGMRTEKSPFFSAVRVFNTSLASSPFAASSLADLALVCSGIVPLINHTIF